jgi:hypothetical protein
VKEVTQSSQLNALGNPSVGKITSVPLPPL